MLMRVEIRPEMLRWARERAGRTTESLRRRFPRIAEWESGAVAPTLKQLEAFANAVWVPIGYLFLPAPPQEELPIPDFRTGRNRLSSPSPNLLDTVYMCQARQAWYADYARTSGQPPADYVGSLTTATPVVEAATAIRDRLGFDLDARRRCSSWTEALRQFIGQADAAGILVMVSGVVRNNTHRKLDPEEFRGFAIADALAPIVFINGADTRAAQMFTLAHELAHIWLGRTALSDAEPRTVADGDVETWCNHVAAELLVPMDVLRGTAHPGAPLQNELVRLARRFKVSTPVILRRMHDAGMVARARFHREYEAELKRIGAIERSSGGDFYLTQPARASRRFVSALVESTLEGRTLYRDALRLLGISRVETFHELGRAVHAIV